jgi:opacity protein-like surface antigen
MRSGLYILLTSAISALALSQTASAADKLVKASIYKAPIVAPAYNWTGLYVGGNVGGAWSGIMLTDNNAGASLNPGGTGFIGGAQAGYNLQAGQLSLRHRGRLRWIDFQQQNSSNSNAAWPNRGFRAQKMDDYARRPRGHHVGSLAFL